MGLLNFLPEKHEVVLNALSAYAVSRYISNSSKPAQTAALIFLANMVMAVYWNVARSYIPPGNNTFADKQSNRLFSICSFPIILLITRLVQQGMGWLHHSKPSFDGSLGLLSLANRFAWSVLFGIQYLRREE